MSILRLLLFVFVGLGGPSLVRAQSLNIEDSDFVSAWQAIMSELESVIRASYSSGPGIHGSFEQGEVPKSVPPAVQSLAPGISRHERAHYDRLVRLFEFKSTDYIDEDTYVLKISEADFQSRMWIAFEKSLDRELSKLKSPKSQGRLLAQFVSSWSLSGPLLSPLVYFGWLANSAALFKVSQHVTERIWNSGNQWAIAGILPLFYSNRMISFINWDELMNSAKNRPMQEYSVLANWWRVYPDQVAFAHIQLKEFIERLRNERPQYLRTGEGVMVWASLPEAEIQVPAVVLARAMASPSRCENALK